MRTRCKHHQEHNDLKEGLTGEINHAYNPPQKKSDINVITHRH